MCKTTRADEMVAGPPAGASSDSGTGGGAPRDVSRHRTLQAASVPSSRLGIVGRLREADLELPSSPDVLPVSLQPQDLLEAATLMSSSAGWMDCAFPCVGAVMETLTAWTPVTRRAVRE